MIGHHAIEQQVVLPLGDRFDPVVFAPDHGRHVRQVLAHEVPGGFFGAGMGEEALLEAAGGLVGRDDQVLLGGAGRGDLPVGGLLFVKGAGVGHHEAGRHERLLHRAPDRVVAVVELHRHPPARLERGVVAAEAGAHQLLIVGQGLAFRLVDDRLGAAVGAHAVPGFQQVVQVGVVDVFAEGRVGEDVVNAVVGQGRGRGRLGGDGCAAGMIARTAECLGDAVGLAVQDVPGRDLRDERRNVVNTGQVAIHLRKCVGPITVHKRHAPNRLLKGEQQHGTQPQIGDGLGLGPQRVQRVAGAGRRNGASASRHSGAMRIRWCVMCMYRIRCGIPPVKAWLDAVEQRQVVRHPRFCVLVTVSGVLDEDRFALQRFVCSSQDRIEYRDAVFFQAGLRNWRRSGDKRTIP